MVNFELLPGGRVVVCLVQQVIVSTVPTNGMVLIPWLSQLECPKEVPSLPKQVLLVGFLPEATVPEGI